MCHVVRLRGVSLHRTVCILDIFVLYRYMLICDANQRCNRMGTTANSKFQLCLKASQSPELLLFYQQLFKPLQNFSNPAYWIRAGGWGGREWVVVLCWLTGLSSARELWQTRKKLVKLSEGDVRPPATSPAEHQLMVPCSLCKHMRGLPARPQTSVYPWGEMRDVQMANQAAGPCLQLTHLMFLVKHPMG